VISSAIGACAWLYQKAWERQERRVKQYEAITDTLPGFAVGSQDPNKINEFIAASRRLWIDAPDDVVRCFDEFTSSIEHSKGHEVSSVLLGKLILAMRRDASFKGAILPRFRTSLLPEQFQLKSAKLLREMPGYRPPPASPQV
jgi:hypothetical protein